MKFLGLFFAVLILIMVPNCCAETYEQGEEIGDSHLVDSLSVQMTQTGTISITKGSLKWIKINLTVPQKTAYQNVGSSYSTVSDGLGNDFAFVYEENPSGVVNYFLQTDVEVTSRFVDFIPTVYTVPDDVKVYLESTENIQSNDLRIKSLAMLITSGACSDFEKIAKLAIWVNEYMTYDLQYTSVVLDAVSVLDDKRGVCAEYTTLFVAFARASGIPARYVSAYAYGDDGWEPHAYAEVYLGKWIPVDALWLEIGNLDATHIKFTVQKDNEVKNDVKMFGTDLGNIVWDLDDIIINTTSVSYLDTVSDFRLDVSSAELEQGDGVVFYAKIKQDDYRVLELDLEPCMSDPPILTFDRNDRKIIIQPGSEEKIVYWTGHVSDKLAKNIIYTCPVTLNSRYLENYVVNLTVSAGSKDPVLLTSSVLKSIISLGGVQEINIDLERMYGADPVNAGVISDNYHDERLLDFSDGKANTVFMFYPEATGRNNVTVYTSTGDVSVLSFEVIEKGSVYIGNVTYPKIVMRGDDACAVIIIVNKKAAGETLKFYYDDVIESLTIQSGSRLSVNKSLDTSSVGDKTIAVEIAGQGVVDVEYVDFVVYDVPDVSYSYDYDYDQMKLYVTLNVDRDYAKNVTLYVDDISVFDDSVLGSEIFDFSVVPGAYELKAEWADQGGLAYSMNDSVVVDEENMLGRIIRMIKEFVQRFEW